MQGIEILNEYITATPFAFHYWAALIAFAILFVVIVTIAIYTRDASLLWLCPFAMLAACLLGGVVGSVAPLECHQETRYEIIIVDDSISASEFLDKYEILEQEGKIYTVRERNKKEGD